MTFYFEPDTMVLERIRRRETAEAYRRQVPVQQPWVELLDQYVQAYPDMDAGIALGLAQAGIDPTSEQAQQIADLSFEQKRRGGFFDRVGDVLSPVTDAVSDVAGAAARGLDTALGEIDESLVPAAKGAIRTGFVVLETGLQETQNFIRAGGWTGVRLAEESGDTSILSRLQHSVLNPMTWDDIASNMDDAGTSSGREVIGALLRGEDVDLGSGFLPGGEIEETVRNRAGRLSLQVGDVRFGGPGGLAITPGRVIAATVSEPGETAFNVLSGALDATVAWFGDPAAALGGAAKTARAGSRASRAGRALVDEGATAAGRALSHSGSFAPVVDTSMHSRAAEALWDQLTGRITGGRNTRNTVSPDLVDRWLTKDGQHFVRRVADTDDFYELWEATGRKMPVDLTVRLSDASTPDEVMDLLRPALGTQLRDAPEFLGFKARRANAQGIRLFGEMPGPFIDPNNMDQAVDQLDRWLRNAKVTPALRNASVEKLARNTSRQTMVVTMSEILGDAADDLAERIGGRGASAKARARRLTEMWGGDHERARAYFVDEIAENRKAAGVQVGGETLPVQSPFLFTEYLNSTIPLPEARELRRATSKLGRLVDNPFFEATTGALGSLQNAWKRLVLMRGAYTVRVIGEEQVRMAASGLDSMFAHPLSAIAALVADEGSISRFIGTGRRRQSDVLGDLFMDGKEAASVELKAALNKGWAGWVDSSVTERGFTTFGRADDGYPRAWAQSLGELYTDPVARKVAAADGNLAEVKRWFFEEQGRKFRKPMIESHPELATRLGSDRYIDTLWEGVQYRTSSDPRLLAAVATGTFDGRRIGQLNESGRWNLNPAFEDYLSDVVGPEAVKGQRILSGGDGGMGEVWDNATGWAFSHLMTKPTNWLSRSQTFRQKYWQRIEEQIPYMDDATRSKAIDAAEGVVDAQQLKRMRQAGPAVDRTITDLADADEIAKAYGLDETKALLYDLTDRGQFFDVFRLLFPFGEAWKEVLTRWAKIGMENPRAIRRAQQFITGARGSGFFHKDVNGEEVFTYPFSRQISDALIGVPVDLTGRVGGLSLMTEVLPGVGPVVQVPAAAFLPDTPDWNFAREFIFPFGETDYSDGFLESFAPGYLRNLMQGFEAGDDRLFGNTVMAMYDHLASTGDYNLSDPKDQARLFDDARDRARSLYVLRGMAQFFSPASPFPETLLESPDADEMLVRREVIKNLYELQDQLGYEEGTAEFVERYGADFLRFTQGNTISIAPMLPVSKEAAEWVQANRDVVDDYSLTWGLFAPSTDTDQIDYTEYVRQVETGQRKPLTVEQRAALGNARIGRHIYSLAEQKVSENPTPAEREWLAAVKEKIRQEYPGYGQLVAGVPFGADLEDQVIPELRRALDDARLAGTPQAKAIGLYLQARDKALAFTEEQFGTTLRAEAAEPARAWLRRVAEALVREYPVFAEPYESVFEREVE